MRKPNGCRSRSTRLPATLTLGLTIAWIAAGGGACAKFADPSTVTDLRVLAVRVEPSEIILDVADPSDLTNVAIPDITLSPLVVDPAGGGRPTLVTISVCANDPSALSPPNNGTDPTGYPAGGAHTTVGSALCDGDPTEIPIATDVDLATSPSVVAHLDPMWVVSAFQRDVFIGPDGHVHGGFDLGMPVVFQITARAGAEIATAVKRTIIWARPVRDDQIPNVSPEIASVTAYDRRDENTAEPFADAIMPLDEGTAVSVQTPGLWIDPAPAAAEPYVTAVLDRLTGQVIPHDIARETLRYTFYASAGTFAPFETSSEPDPGVTVASRIHIESKYHPPAAGPVVGAVTIWIVVRDERGGVSWVTRALEVPATSASSSHGP